MRGVRRAFLLALAFLGGMASDAFADDPGLLPVDVETHETGGVDWLQIPFDVELSADGDHAYATSWYAKRIATFERDPTTGSLTFVGAIGAAGEQGSINSMVTTPTGHDLYALTTGGISTFDTDTRNGEPALRQSMTPEQVPALAGGFDVTVAPDLGHVYVATVYNRLLIFDRLRSGRLRHEETVAPFGREKYPIFQAVEVSPDGRTLYASRCSEAGPTLGVFRRSTSSGRLRLVQRLRTPGQNPSGVDCMRGIAATRTGVAAAASRNGILGYARDPQTGRLQLRNSVSSAGGSDLFDPWAVTATDSGRTIFATGSQSGRLVRLSMRRGRVGLRGYERDGQAGVDAMTNPYGVAADASNVYVTSITDSSLTAFSRPGPDR